jgi:hypothetical protein
MNDNVLNPSPSSTPANLPVFQPASNGGQLQVAASVQASVNMGDLVAIATSSAEKALREQVGKIRTKVTGANQTVTALKAQANLILSGWVRQQFTTDARISPLLLSLVPFSSSPIVPSHSPATFNIRSDTFSGTTSITTDSGTLSISYSGATPPEYRELLTAIEAAEKAHDQLSRELLTARSALANVGALETHARAQIASNYISRTEGGADLLKSLSETIDSESLISQLSSM